jgi:hypothetical protein
MRAWVEAELELRPERVAAEQGQELRLERELRPEQAAPRVLGLVEVGTPKLLIALMAKRNLRATLGAWF